MSFTVYSKKGCPYCDKIKMVLNDLSIRKGYPVICYELGTEFTREQFYAEFGEGSTFPQVVFDKKNIGGCSDTVKYLQENNMF
jgi:glutaredoxin